VDEKSAQPVPSVIELTGTRIAIATDLHSNTEVAVQTLNLFGIGVVLLTMIYGLTHLILRKPHPR